MYKIQEFWGRLTDEEGAVKKANDWLAKNGNRIEPISISKSISSTPVAIHETLTILYKEI